MKSSKVLLSIALLSAVSAATSFALPSSLTTMPPGAERPVPTTVVAPTELPRCAINSVVKLSLLIDSSGVPHAVTVLGHPPEEVSRRVIEAVSHWRFTPMRVNGNNTPVHAILPLRLVEGDAS